MKDSRAVITGLARDLGRLLPRTMARIEALGNMFGDYRVLIYENDSSDLTRPLLKAWSLLNRRVTVIGSGRGDPPNPQRRCLERTARMAYYRNSCREFVIENFPDYPFVVVLDTDLNGGWSYDGIAHTFGHDDWDSVGSNGIFYRNWEGQRNRPLQFDVWAFRWQGDYGPHQYTEINPLHWPRGGALVPLFSCFGGLGVYRMEAMKLSFYDGSDCEHVTFHRRMRDNGLGRQYMNPSQIILY